jgi:glutaconate CoA-transferase subunit A
MRISASFVNVLQNSKIKLTRAMKMTIDKRISLHDAIETLDLDGKTLALGGVTLYRRPMAFSLALLNHYRHKPKPQELTLLSFTAGVESDILIGAGMVTNTRSCYFGLEAFGLAPHFTSAAASGEINIIEETEASLAFGIRATLAGVGFMPSNAWQGTDLFQLRPDVKTILDPYSGEELTAFPAVECDIAVIHALEADPHGNAIIGGNLGVDRELSLAAGHVVVTADRISPNLSKTDIIGPAVHAVIETPKGAWPTSCHPLYPLDSEAILRYTESVGHEIYDELLSAWCEFHSIEFKP